MAGSRSNLAACRAILGALALVERSMRVSRESAAACDQSQDQLYSLRSIQGHVVSLKCFVGWAIRMSKGGV